MLDDFLFPRLGGDLHADPYDGPSPVEALLPVARQDPGEGREGRGAEPEAEGPLDRDGPGAVPERLSLDEGPGRRSLEQCS